MTIHALRPVTAFDDIRIDMACVVGLERTQAAVVVHMRSGIRVGFSAPPFDAARLDETFQQMHAVVRVRDSEA